MRTLKLMADYNCFPLWEASLGAIGNINPKDLPISKLLQNKLISWAAEFDDTLDIDNPIQSGFKDDLTLEKFNKIGAELVLQLRRELGVEYSIFLKLKR